MTDQLVGANGRVYLVSAGRTPIGKFGGALTLCLGGDGSVAMAFERV